MADMSIDTVVESANLARADEDGTPIDAPPKLRGRLRLLQSLQRISSTPSLARLGRTSSSGYRGSGKGSISCVSLSSAASPYGHSYAGSAASGLSAEYSTAPTSSASTPGVDLRFGEQHARIRPISPDGPTSVALPPDVRPGSRTGVSPEAEEDYFSQQRTRTAAQKKREKLRVWDELPHEVWVSILRYLSPKEIIRCSGVSKSWHKICFDGQLWGSLDISDCYSSITADAIINIITSAGPFVRDLNLRGCVQLLERWTTRGLTDACRNLENFSIEGCRIDRTSLHCFLLQNTRLVHINLSKLAGATNSAMKIIAQYCPKVEYLNVSWCTNIDNRGLRKVVEACHNLKDLRAGEIKGLNDTGLMNELFKRNSVERLVLNSCLTLSDESLKVLMQGVNSEIDPLTGRAIAPPRRLKHLDISYCAQITDRGVRALAYHVPNLQGLQLNKCIQLTDLSLTELFSTTHKLTHLELEDVHHMTNTSLQCLARSPAKDTLYHLCVSYCESVGDTGMLPILKNCPNLGSLDLDNTRISDLVLIEAAANVRRRVSPAPAPASAAWQKPRFGLRMYVYDCANVTWTGVREVLSRNAEIIRPGLSSQAGAEQPPTYPGEIIQLKCFYNWQPTVEEHTKRVMRGDFVAAARLERKWAEWMMLNEEAGVGGAGTRRRRRRAREARMMHADEEEGGAVGTGGGIGRRRRARSGPGGCVVM